MCPVLLLLACFPDRVLWIFPCQPQTVILTPPPLKLLGLRRGLPKLLLGLVLNSNPTVSASCVAGITALIPGVGTIRGEEKEVKSGSHHRARVDSGP
jgi:hypothetical protein